MYKYILDARPGEDKIELIDSRIRALHISTHNSFCEFDGENLLDHHELMSLSREVGADFNYLPEEFDPAEVKLVISDMDSTFINIECIDEIADFAGKKAQVSAVTEAAMRGELDFAQSLTQRVALLKGLSVDVLNTVFAERLRLNSGAEVMLAGLKNHDIKFALVSGGFTYFTSKLMEKYRLDYSRANELKIEEGHLCGSVNGQIVDAAVKQQYLETLCAELGISTRQAMAVGDGANDLKMMSVAGLGVAYHAKPKVQQEAGCMINLGGLDGLLSLLGLNKP
ncbi:MAG: phosphoserine phosphatase SerB [Gammaproteobacteria bacterium]|nr:phosphoserine phosphatase SerB [Gammaproteobacteria bacterium]